VTAVVGRAGDARSDSVEMVGWSAMEISSLAGNALDEFRIQVGKRLRNIHIRALSRARAHCGCPRRDRRKRIVGLRECDARRRHSRCHSPRTETSARPVSKSSSKEDQRSYAHPKDLDIGQDVAQTIWLKSRSSATQTKLAARLVLPLPCIWRPWGRRRAAGSSGVTATAPRETFGRCEPVHVGQRRPGSILR
jgi:hypothetical protein